MIKLARLQTQVEMSTRDVGQDFITLTAAARALDYCPERN